MDTWFDPEIAFYFKCDFSDNFCPEKSLDEYTVKFFLLSYYIFPLFFDNAKICDLVYEKKYDNCNGVLGDVISIKCELGITKTRILNAFFGYCEIYIVKSNKNFHYFNKFGITSNFDNQSLIMNMKSKRNIARIYRSIRKDTLYKVLYPNNKYIITDE